MSNTPPQPTRSAAGLRRLRLRRKQKRVRLFLVGDNAVLAMHHASEVPQVPRSDQARDADPRGELDLFAVSSTIFGRNSAPCLFARVPMPLLRLLQSLLMKFWVVFSAPVRQQKILFPLQELLWPLLACWRNDHGVQLPGM